MELLVYQCTVFLFFLLLFFKTESFISNQIRFKLLHVYKKYTPRSMYMYNFDNLHEQMLTSESVCVGLEGNWGR